MKHTHTVNCAEKALVENGSRTLLRNGQVCRFIIMPWWISVRFETGSMQLVAWKWMLSASLPIIHIQTIILALKLFILIKVSNILMVSGHYNTQGLEKETMVKGRILQEHAANKKLSGRLKRKSNPIM